MLEPMDVDDPYYAMYVKLSEPEKKILTLLRKEYDEILQLKTENEDILEEMKNLEERKDNEILQLKTENEDIKIQLEEMKNLEERKDNEILQLKTENEDNKIQLEEMKNLEKRKDDEILQLKTENEDNKIQLEEMKNLEERKDNEISQLETENEVNKIQLKEMKNLEEQKDNEISQLKNEIHSLKSKIKPLEEKNKKLNDENSEWQNYIGKATTFSLNDSDVNHSAQLAKDIEGVKEKIVNYIGNLRPKVDINLEKVNNLLLSYDCHAQVKSKVKLPLVLPLVKAVLQRYVFQTIIEYAEYNLLENCEIQCLERDIYKMTNKLHDLSDKFSTYDGANEITKAFPIKMHQQMYGLLGSLGLANNVGDKNKEHPIIVEIKNKLNKKINELRTIRDPKKSEKHDDMAPIIIQELIRIYFFRLKVQEPPVEIIWFNYNDGIDPNLMEERYEEENTDEIDEANNPLVELCSFPLFVSNYNKKGQKIYSRAKIIYQVKQSR
ncbi:hypothetical protein RclHR1_01240005 [Rhizophagus clarus]|nr:hypothetical protein RclHR1_01240005 [Rhizophagus clarus]